MDREAVSPFLPSATNYSPQTHTNYSWLQVPAPGPPAVTTQCPTSACSTPPRENFHQNTPALALPPRPLSAVSGLVQSFEQSDKASSGAVFPRDHGHRGHLRTSARRETVGQGVLGPSLTGPTQPCLQDCPPGLWAPHPKPSRLFPPVAAPFLLCVVMGLVPSSLASTPCHHPPILRQHL